MCGQFGVAGNLFNEQDNFMEDMFIMDSIRGPHSCGLLTVGAALYAKPKVLKRAIPAMDFIDLNKYAKATNGKNRIMAGHNRWASVGAVNQANAHPFTIGDITGMHNGTLTHQQYLVDDKDFDVDSENIIHSINKVGVDETWKNTVGPAALVWYDDDTGKLHLLRNSERPLFFVYSKNLNQMYWASERYMLLAALERNGIQSWDVESLPVNQLYSFDVNIHSTNPKEVVKCSVRKLEPAREVFQPKQNTWRPPAQGSGYVTKTGTQVDFMVLDVEQKPGGEVEYLVGDNVCNSTYTITDLYDTLDLEIGSCRVGRLTSRVKDSYYIGVHSIKDTSEFLEDKESDREAELVAEEVGTRLSVVPSDDGTMPTSPPDVGTKEIVNGNVYELDDDGFFNAVEDEIEADKQAAFDTWAEELDAEAEAEQRKHDEEDMAWKAELQDAVDQFADSPSGGGYSWSELSPEENDTDERVQEWSVLQHTDCSLCSSPVQPHEGWVSDGRDGCFCEDCAASDTVKPYLQGVAHAL